ncbi:hypothetical protein C7I55_00810 [Sphingomonas deserti]|uniref:Uncharacterized protein n=1 Tax=Allosphingosinicella deserti TaxID=2116704 RepID=A0A2P7QYF6_9SPHN|nr:hypothetical protein C7I55_00810 [Sphingomonas deserti]
MPSNAREDETDFEAALTRQQPRPKAARPSGPKPASSDSSAPAPQASAAPGTLPPEWRSVSAIRDRDTWMRATRDARDGRLDPFALVEQVTGGIPLPPGARPARCRYTPLRLLYTSGSPVSAEYDRLRVQAAKDRPGGKDHVRFYMGHTAIAVAATQARMDDYERFYLSQGFERVAGHAKRTREQRVFLRPSPAPGKPALRISIVADAYSEFSNCADQGVIIPSGPTFDVTLEP